MGIRKKGKTIRWLIFALTFIVFILIAQKIYNNYLYKHSEANLTNVERTWLNYSEATLKSAKDLELPPEYLLALIALESGGFREVSSRFEPHVFVKLQALRDGEIDEFAGIFPGDIENTTDDALKNLASSWGPFQLMGYQCLHLKIQLKEMRGKNAIWIGAQWIKETYGKDLSKKRFKNAFHKHNTGKPYPKIGPPKTHSSSYVPRGQKYMKEFKQIIKREESEAELN